MAHTPSSSPFPLHAAMSPMLSGETESCVATNNQVATILIVDSEIRDRELIEALLTPEGYAVVSVATGEQALARVARSPPDLILIDTPMSHVDGCQVVRTLKLDPATSNIPIILVTAQKRRDARLAGLTAGAEEVVTKPVDGIELCLRVRNLLRLKAHGDFMESHGTFLEAKVQARTADLQRFRTALDTTGDAIFLVDRKTMRYVDANSSACVMLGYTRDELMSMGPAQTSMAPLEQLERVYDAVIARHPTSELAEVLLRCKDGKQLQVEARRQAYRAGPDWLVVSVLRDIAERKHAVQEIAHLRRLYAVLSGINAVILRVRDRAELFRETCQIAVEEGGFRMSLIGILDKDGVIEPVASAGKDQDLMEAIKARLSSRDAAPTTMVAQAMREKGIVVSNDSINDPRVTLGEQYARAGVRSLVVLPLIVSDRAVGVLALYAREVGFFREEELKLLAGLAGDVGFAIDYIGKQERLDYLAYYDPVTGLPNLQLFRDRLDQFINAARHTHGTVCVEVVDLKQFTQINNAHGRAFGDEMLRRVGARFQEFLVEPYALGHMGADTFAVASPTGDKILCTRLRDCMEEALKHPFCIHAHEISITIQAGIALFPNDGVDGASVFKSAELALQMAKTLGARCIYHSSEMNARVAERVALEEQLRVALENQQFVLHYQPKVDMISGRIVGAEALIRWQHPAKGLLAPKEFIGLAEETGLIEPIGAWVIHAVCAQQAMWAKARLRIVPIAVNLASSQFDSKDLLQTVRTALTTHAVEPKNLELELTESAVMNNSTDAALTLRALRNFGVGLALDDFGTGYSSLAHLKRFPFNSVKIDRSFVTDITQNAEDATIAIAIIAMGHSLGLKVVAEGVETQGQFNYLRTHGCDQMQGYLFGPAVPVEVFEADLCNDRCMQFAASPDNLHTLLLVDDEPLVRAALIRMLRPDGYKILCAGSGAEGLELLSLNPVQVIISDQRMPEMTGTEFLDTVRQMYPDTVRMILSGYTDLNVVTEAVNLGAVFKFLTKPWDDEVLREHVRDAFRRYRPQSVH